MLTHLLIPTNTNDQPIDLMDDIDEYVCDLPVPEAMLSDTLGDTILDSYRAIWS
jgi:hypothetical protein